jgi:octanoyl-[GcvH]:protein N-octanoyltransferase
MDSLPRLELVSEPTGADGPLGTAVSRAVLAQVATGALPATMRLHRASEVISFGRQDALAPGFARAIRASKALGFTPVLRLAGGRAAAFHDGTLAFALATPEADPRAGVRQRFEQVASCLAAAFRSLGIDAQIGEVPGEYCPGEWSVNARGRVKLAGIGQRLVNGAAHVGGVVVTDDAERIRDVLEPVYAALGLDWDPATAGSVADEAPGATLEDVMAAIRAEFARGFEVVDASINAETLALAERLAPKHAIPL